MSGEIFSKGLLAVSAVAMVFVLMRLVIWGLVYLVNNDRISKDRIPMFLDSYLKWKFLEKYKGRNAR